MIYAQLNGNQYVALMGELYVKFFREFTEGNIINLDAMAFIPDVERKYKLRKLFFDYLCNSLTLLNDQGDPVPEFGEEISNICSRMWRVDDLAVYLAKEKRYEDAIKQMDKLILEILKLSNKMFNNEKKI